MVERILDAVEWIKDKSVETVVTVQGKKRFLGCLSKKYYRMVKEKRKRYTFLKQNRLNVKNDRRLKELKREIQKEYRINVRNSWKKDSERKLKDNELEWSYFKRFNNKSVDVPESLNANNFAERFQELSHTYNPIPKNPSKNINKITNFKFQYKIDIESSKMSLNINKLIMKCKNSSNSSAWDGVNLKFLRLMSKTFHKLIAYVIGCCLKSGCYEKRFRVVKAMPVYKKGNPQDVKNWRPIQIANWACNLLEKVMCLQMTEFWERKGLLGKNQFGFRAHHSVGQLINALKREFFRRGSKYGIILLTDLSNAFGSADSWLIIEKMRPYLSNQALKLLRSFLIQADVRVKVNNEISETFVSADRGYSQGSNLSTFLFIVLMKESHKLGLDNIGFSFADDMSILITSDDVSDLNNKANVALENFHNFCKNTNIKLNCSKTFYTPIGKKFKSSDKSKLKLETDGQTIKLTDTMNILGIDLDKTLSFDHHLNGLARPIQNKIINIIPFSHFSTNEFCSSLVKGFGHGKFQHGLNYMPLFESKKYNKINKPIFNFLRRKFATYRELKDESYLRLSQAEIYKRSKIPSLKNIHRMCGLSRLNKILLNLTPLWEVEQVLELFTKKTLSNWTNNRLGVEFMRISQIPKDERDLAPAIWIEEFNKLPKRIRNLIGSYKFENEIKIWFKIQRCQHQENFNVKCKLCNQSCKNYEGKVLDKTPNKLIDRPEDLKIDTLMNIIINSNIKNNKKLMIKSSINKYKLKHEKDFDYEYVSNIL